MRQLANPASSHLPLVRQADYRRTTMGIPTFYIPDEGLKSDVGWV
jgi:hypothetical protein